MSGKYRSLRKSIFDVVVSPRIINEVLCGFFMVKGLFERCIFWDSSLEMEDEKFTRYSINNNEEILLKHIISVGVNGQFFVCVFALLGRD